MIEPTAVGILIFEDAEVLDFCGPFEAFSVAVPPDSDNDSARLFHVHIIAESADVVSCRNGLKVVPDYTIDDHPALDILLVPGGRGVNKVLSNARVLQWIAEQSSNVQLTTSVCTGAFLLAAVGLLDGKSATTHWASINSLRERHSKIDVCNDRRWVDEGDIVTAAGVSAGIDMSLHIIQRLHGSPVAESVARTMEYAWQQEP